MKRRNRGAAVSPSSKRVRSATDDVSFTSGSTAGVAVEDDTAIHAPVHVTFAAFVLPIQDQQRPPAASLGDTQSSSLCDEGKAAQVRHTLPPLKVLKDHAVVFSKEDGLIVDILPWDAARRKYCDRVCTTTTDVSETHALLPGLINCHTHTPMTLLRGFADDVGLQTWLNSHIFPAEQEHVDESFAFAGTNLAIAEMLRGGTTTFNDMYFYPTQTAYAARRAGMRCVLGAPVLKFPSRYAANNEEYETHAHALFNEFHHHRHSAEQCASAKEGMLLRDPTQEDILTTVSAAPHAPYSVTDEQLSMWRDMTAKYDSILHCHIHETKGEIDTAVEQHGERPLKRLDRLGLVNDRLVAVHATQLLDEEIELLRRKRASVVHCPESNCKLSSGVARVKDLFDAGVNVALGTDSAASNNDLDMWGEMRTAAMLAKIATGDASALYCDQILRMATINGARALHLAHLIGSLEVGKSADMVAVRVTGTVETTPMYDVKSHLVFAVNRNDVTDVWVAGKRKLLDRKLVSVDESRVVREAKRWQGIIARARDDRCRRSSSKKEREATF